MLGWRLTIIDSLGDDDIAHLLGLDREEDFGDAEQEEPELLAIVRPNGDPPHPAVIESALLRDLAAGPWEGKANGLSSDHVQWDIIDMVKDATKKPRTEARARLWSLARISSGPRES